MLYVKNRPRDDVIWEVAISEEDALRRISQATGPRWRTMLYRQAFVTGVLGAVTGKDFGL